MTATTSDSPTTTSSSSPGGCVEYEGGLTICFGRSVELSRRPDPDRETRWCFRCRAHLPHEFVVYGDPEPSYYEPNLAVECSRCHEEHIYFPGCGPL